MGKRKNKSKSGFVSGLIRKPTLNERMAMWRRMEAGDIDALMECAFLAGLDTEEQLRDYYRIKAEMETERNEYS